MQGISSAAQSNVFTLNDVTQGRTFQRSAGATSGPVSLSGAVAGQHPSGVDAQILLASNSSIVVDWTSISNFAISGGGWSGKLLSVPQGGPYTVNVRATDNHARAGTGTNTFSLGIIFLLHGQSNMTGMLGSTSAPGTPIAGTSFYDGTNGWQAIPAGSGIRNFLSAVNTATGVPCAALCVAVIGVSIGNLLPVGANYTNALQQMAAIGNDFEMVLWDQGEGDASNSPHEDGNSYLTQLATMYSLLQGVTGRSSSQLPFVLSSIGHTTSSGGSLNGGITDATWSTIQKALFDAPSRISGVVYSHSQVDLAVGGDQLHYTDAAHGQQGLRFAHTVNRILGLATGNTYWTIGSASTVDATHTNVNLTQSAGTDFTPTTASDEWQITGDNGVTWSAPSAISRNSGTQIQLTHASLSTSNTRKLRYQYGQCSALAAPVLDNSTLQLPLNFTTWDVVPTSLSTLPVPNYRYSVNSTGTGASQSASNLPLGPEGVRQFVIIALAGSAGPTLTLTPNVGSPVSATLVKQQGNTSIWQALLGTDAASATTFNLSIQYSGNPFGGNWINVWTVPFANLSSTTATGFGGSTTTSSISGSATAATSSGGFTIAIGYNTAWYTDFNTPGSISGTESYVKNFEWPSGVTFIAGCASNVGANAASSVTVSLQNAGTCDVAVAAWR